MVLLSAEETDDEHWKFQGHIEKESPTQSPFFCSGVGRRRKKADYPEEEIILLMSEKVIIWNFSGWSLAGDFN